MKNFLKMLLASILGVFTGMGCFLFVLIPMMIAGMAGAVVAVVGGGEQPQTKVEHNTVLKVDLSMISEVVEENPIDQLLGDSDQSPISLSNALRAIRKAKHNPDIVGIYLAPENLSAGVASVDEVRQAIEDFKLSGKFVVSYADTYDQKAYYLSTVADHILLNPIGDVALVGISSSNLMFKGLLDKLGVKSEVFKVGTYKAAVEPFILEHISDANREQIEGYIGGLWGSIASTIAEARGIAPEALNELVSQGIAFDSSERMREVGLVDSLIYRTEVGEFVANLIDPELTEKDLHMLTLSDMLGVSSSDEPNGDDVIAVLTLEGEIMPETYSQFGSSGQVIGYSYVDKIKKLTEDDEVKAVVLRINSPGGSAFISEQIYEAVRQLREKKPVVTSMGDVVASGGYYIASASNYIISGRNTLTGSIGVFGLLQNASELAKRAGVTLDVVKTNPHADFGSLSMMLHPIAPEQRTLIQKQVERTYDLFLSRVSVGRKLPTEEVDKVGQGRVWLGEKAMELGLVDELGGLQRAIAKAAELANLSEYSVDYGTTVKNLLEELLEQPTSTGEFVASLRYLFLSPAEQELLKLLERHSTPYDLKARLPYEIHPY